MRTKWQLRHPEKIREYNKKARRKLKTDALNAYSENGAHCFNCKTREIDFLCLDHIDNDGAKCRKLRGGGNSFFFWLRKNKYPKKLRLQVLCYNCNNYKKINKRLP